jgi:class 3 adenylate cyclase
VVFHPLGAGFAAVVAVALILPWTGFVAALDLRAIDQQVFFLRAYAPRSVENDVVIVGIDEETDKALREPYTLWHPYIGDFFKAMAQARPAVVGLDINLPDRSYNFLLKGLDAKLLRGILALRDVAPVVFGLTVDASGRARRIFPPFVSTAGPKSTGYVLWRLDADRVVRRFDESIAQGGQAVPTLVGRMARHMGIEPKAGMINYAVGEPFGYVPFHKLLEWFNSGDVETLRRVFEGKPVLLGSVLPFVDRHYQQVDLAGWEENDNFAPGMLIHAQALRSLMGPGLIDDAPMAAVVVMVLMAAFLWWPARHWGVGLLSLLGFAGLATGASTWLLYGGLYLPLSAILLTALLAVGSRITYSAAEQVLERRRLRRAFGGYVSPQIMEEIVEGRLDTGLGGERRKICVMFSDIRGFTARSETMTPEQVIDFLNRYFERMANAIHDQQGTVDKFIGDGIMAFFSAPKTLEDPCFLAFTAAQNMLEGLEELNAELEIDGLSPIRIGIGLHLGDAVVGHVGSETRHEYAAIGDVVNVSSRIEGLTKDSGYQLFCSEPVVLEIGDRAHFDELGLRDIKGHTPVKVFGWPRKESQGSGA